MSAVVEGMADIHQCVSKADRPPTAHHLPVGNTPYFLSFLTASDEPASLRAEQVAFRLSEALFASHHRAANGIAKRAQLYRFDHQLGAQRP